MFLEGDFVYVLEVDAQSSGCIVHMQLTVQMQEIQLIGNSPN